LSVFYNSPCDDVDGTPVNYKKKKNTDLIMANSMAHMINLSVYIGHEVVKLIINKLFF